MTQNETTHNDELSLKEVILKVQEYVSEIKRKWWVVIIICTVVSSFYLYQHFQHEITYGAKLQFVIEGQSGVGGGLNSLLGSFGIKKGGKVNPYKILEVGKSTDLFIKVMSTKGKAGENIGNRLLKTYDLPSIWAEIDPSYENFRFDEKIELGDLQQQKGIKKLKKVVWGTETTKKYALTRFSHNEDNGLFTLNTHCIDEDLSLDISTTFYKEIKKFFEEDVFENQKHLADILTVKADSLKQLRDQKILQIAKFDDRNTNTIYRSSTVERQILAQENLAITSAYIEILKNKEMTDVNLKDIQPLFMAIETPFVPLSPVVSLLTKKLFTSFLIGGFLSCLLIIGRKVYRDTLGE